MSRYLYAIGASVLLVLLMASHWKAYHLGATIKQAEFNLAIASTSEKFRKQEAELQIISEKVRADYVKQKTINAGLVRVAAKRLREYEAASAAFSASEADRNAAAASRADGPYRLIADQCAAALVVLDEHASGLRATASSLQEFASSLRLK